MSRDWCFTSYATELELVFDENKVKYICYGKEVCPTSGRRHYQGYAIFNRTCRRKQAQLWIGDSGAHLEPKRGTRDQARDYCFKPGGELWGEQFEWGEYESMTKEILFTKSKVWLLANGYEEFFCRFHRAICEKQDKGAKWRDVKVEWLHGEPDTGKTRRVMEMEDVYKWDSPYNWFDGYGGEKILLIDDYEEGEIPARQLKNLLDGYQQKLNIKGGHCYAQWEKVYITSNHHPNELKEWHVKGIPRRIHSVTVCRGAG